MCDFSRRVEVSILESVTVAHNHIYMLRNTTFGVYFGSSPVVHLLNILTISSQLRSGEFNYARLVYAR